MRLLLTVALLSLAACASTSDPGAARSAPERQNTTVTYSGADGSPININLQSGTALETKSFAMPGTPRQVWAALPLAYQDLGIALAAYDSAQMFIGNPGLDVRSGRVGSQRISRYVNCGMDPMHGAVADRSNVRLSVISRVRTGADGALLETQVTANATQRGVSSQAVGCSSTGQLEEALSNATKLRLAGGHPSR